jgi:hypothetical protein
LFSVSTQGGAYAEPKDIQKEDSPYTKTEENTVLYTFNGSNKYLCCIFATKQT